MWPYVTVYVRVYVDACFPVFPHFRAVFATKTSWIWARFLSFLVYHHCKFSAQLEFRVKSKKKKSQKKNWSGATLLRATSYATLHSTFFGIFFVAHSRPHRADFFEGFFFHKHGPHGHRFCLVFFKKNPKKWFFLKKIQKKNSPKLASAAWAI
jgi:hypothetical protein